MRPIERWGLILSALLIIATTVVLYGQDSEQSPTVEAAPITIHSVFAERVPVVTRPSIVLQTHLYLSIIDREYRQPVFVAYHVSRSDFDTDNKLSRNFHTPPELRDVLLERGDLASSEYDIGHAYALASVSARRFASEVNSFACLFVQEPDLNRGPWYDVEKRIRTFADDQDVKVMAGQLFECEMPRLPNADEAHEVASHNWIWFRAGPLEEAYLFPQWEVERQELASDYEIEPAALFGRVADRWYVFGAPSR
jgi:endonuclease G